MDCLMCEYQIRNILTNNASFFQNKTKFIINDALNKKFKTFISPHT